MVREDNGPFPRDVYQKPARVRGLIEYTIVYRVRRFGSMAFIARPRGHVVTYSIDVDRRVIRVRPINSEVSTGSEPRDVVSGGGHQLVRAQMKTPNKPYPSG